MTTRSKRLPIIVKGTWCFNYTAQTSRCKGTHKWRTTDTDGLTQECLHCEGKRWWRGSHERQRTSYYGR